MRTLFTLASRQVWPQVLGYLQLSPRPGRVVLFHSREESESANPARRLRDLFSEGCGVPPREVLLREVPHDQFEGVMNGLAACASELELDETNCIVNLTGGNKLMAMGAAEWCRRAGVPSFYLERDLRAIRFRSQGGDLQPDGETRLAANLANDLDPALLLQCQIEASLVADPGQRLTLSEEGRRREDDFQRLMNEDRDLDFAALILSDPAPGAGRAGDRLELAVAFCLLKLGVPVVRRGIRLKPRVIRGSGLEEAELDLVFNWAGKLWLVDCKDRLSPEHRVDRLRNEILDLAAPTPRLTELLDRLAEELRLKDLKPLKEDLLMVGEAAGLLGRAICVRRAELPLQAKEFAASRNLQVILARNLWRDLEGQLFPNRPATKDQLRALVGAQTRAKA